MHKPDRAKEEEEDDTMGIMAHTKVYRCEMVGALDASTFSVDKNMMHKSQIANYRRPRRIELNLIERIDEFK